MTASRRFSGQWPFARPAVRVVVSDADPTICGATAHLVGVAFRTPFVAEALKARVRVEVLGDYQLNSPLMVTAMGESFAAEPLNNFDTSDDVIAVVTVTGLSPSPQERAFIEATRAPIVCLNRLGSELVSAQQLPALNNVACSPSEAFNSFGNYDLSIAEIADRCFAFTTIVANELAG